MHFHSLAAWNLKKKDSPINSIDGHSVDQHHWDSSSKLSLPSFTIHIATQGQIKHNFFFFPASTTSYSESDSCLGTKADLDRNMVCIWLGVSLLCNVHRRQQSWKSVLILEQNFFKCVHRLGFGWLLDRFCPQLLDIKFESWFYQLLDIYHWEDYLTFWTWVSLSVKRDNHT